MHHIQIKSSANNNVLFEGKFKSLKTCIEQAVADKVDLSRAALRHANLSNANLDEAKMPGALLYGANLTGTNLSDAILTGADLRFAALYNTCLCGSDLRRVDFTGTIFGGTDIYGADISGSRFSTLSSYYLDYTGARDMRGCAFQDMHGQVCPMSRPSLVITGLTHTPVVIFDRHIRVGAAIRTHEQWFGEVAARYLASRHKPGKIRAA